MKLQRRMGFYKKVIALVLFCAVSFSPAFDGTVKAQSQGTVTLTVQAGLDGFCKSNLWFPIRVTVENTGADVNARVQASYKNDMNGQTTYGQDISLPATSRKEFFIYIHPDGTMRNFVVSVLDGNKTLEKKNLNMNCTYDPVTFFGVIADQPSTFTILNDVRPLMGLTRVGQLRIEDLPDQAQGWDALDALVISNVDTGTLDAGQKQAMQLWLARGGKLFVTGGAHWQATSAGLGEILPVKLTSTKNVTGLSALGTYAKDLTMEEQGAILAAGQLQDDANVLVKQDGVPLLVEKQVGFGKVYFLAADPGLQPLIGWNGMKGIYDHLLGFKSPRPVWADASWDSYQVNDALAALPELALPAFGYICCWLGLYVFVIGPLNYFVLRRFKRTELAWITIPVLVVLFTGLAYVSGFAYRGTRPILNRIMLMQGWDGVDRAQANALVGVYSPSRTAYTVETQEQFMLYPLSSVGGNLQGNDNWLSVKNDAGTILPDMRVEIGGMQSVGTSGSLPALTIQHDLTVTLGNKVPKLTGTITNTGNTTINDAVIVTPSGWRTLGDIPPNGTKKVDFLLENNSSTTETSQYAVQSTLGMNYSSYGYSNEDPEQRRRSAFFMANTGTSSGNIHVNAGIYLMGWINDLPVPTGLQGKKSETMDTVLVFEKLDPAVKKERGAIRLTSSIYNWESSLGDTITTSYYNLSNDGYTLRFQPGLPVHFSSVDSLILDVHATSTPDKIQVSIWNFETNSWTSVPLVFYSASVTDAWQYVGMDGEIRLNIKGTPNDYADITGVDFTLMVQP